MVTGRARPHESDATGQPGSGRQAMLKQIPLALRMGFYSLFFLALVLVVLPWSCYRLDVLRPTWHVEIGWWRLLGAGVFAAFFVAYTYCSHVLTSRGRGAYVEFDPPTQFVAEGPYRWARNPVAASVVGMVLGEAIALSSTGIGLLFLAAIPLAHLQVVLLEEPLLRKRFGAAYEDYLRRVPRWLPRRPGKDHA